MLYSEMQTGRKHKMQTMDLVLLEYYQKGDISYDVALTNAREPDQPSNRLSQRAIKVDKTDKHHNVRKPTVRSACGVAMLHSEC